MGISSSSFPTIKKPGTFILGASSLRGSSSYMLKLAFYLIVPDIILRAPVTIIAGIFEFFLQISVIRSFKLVKGLSNMATLRSVFLFKYLRAVTAPIDLPQMPIFVTLFLALT